MHIDPSWPRLASAILGLALAASLAGCSDDNDVGNLGSNLRVGVATVPITPVWSESGVGRSDHLDGCLG